MVSVVVHLKEETLEKLKARAHGAPVDEFLSELLSNIADDDVLLAADVALSEEQERSLIDADAEVEGGTFLTRDEMKAQMKAARGR